MTPVEYLAEVRRTCSSLTNETTIQLGLLGEAGEVCDLVKKSLERGTPIDRLRMIEELGDVLWYVTAKLDSLGLYDADPWGMNSLPAHESAVLLVNACAALGSGRYRFQAQAAAPDAIACVLSIYLAVTPDNTLAPDYILSDLREVNVAKLRRRHPDGFAGAQ